MPFAKYRRRALYVLCAVAATSGAATVADEWTQWRGSARDGAASDFSAPASWPSTLTRRWSVQVGTGHATPVVSDGRVFVFAREDEHEVLRCLDAASGREIWRERYPAAYEMHTAAERHGKGPKSTPVVAGGRVFTLGISGVLSCLDAEKGAVQWRKDFSGTFAKTSPLFGTAMSPIVVDRVLIAHVGGHDAGSLTAFDVQSGRTVWQWDEDGPAYTSPILTTLDGRRQLVTQTQRFTAAFDPKAGTLLWRIPYTTQHTMNIVTPVVHQQRLIISGFNKPLEAIEAKAGNGGWSTRTAWSNPDLPMFMSSPVLVGDLLFGFSQRRKGQLFCLRAGTGRTLWKTRGRMGDNAAIVVAGDVLLVLTTESELLVVRPIAEKFDLIARYKVSDRPTWAHPVPVERDVLIKDETSLARWAIGE